MIRSFADKTTEELFVSGCSRGLPPKLRRRAIRKLDALDAASKIDDLKVPPGNRLHALDGNRQGQYSIAVNVQWRLCFRFFDGDAYDVEITDYH